MEEKRAQLATPDTPSQNQDHDVLIFPRKQVAGEWEYYRVPVTKTDQGSEHRGEFHAPPERWNLSDHGQRKVLGVAHAHHEKLTTGSDSEPRGPAFAALPIRPDPGSASFPTCFLINVEQLDVPNLWSVEEWDDGPFGPNLPTPEHPEEIEVLLALPQARVIRLKLSQLSQWKEGEPDATKAAPEGSIAIENVDLRQESELWSQLRNGTIAGRVKVSTSAQPVPLVNLTALLPGASRAGVLQEQLPRDGGRPEPKKSTVQTGETA